jgi:hypothetical protein
MKFPMSHKAIETYEKHKKEKADKALIASGQAHYTAFSVDFESNTINTWTSPVHVNRQPILHESLEYLANKKGVIKFYTLTEIKKLEKEAPGYWCVNRRWMEEIEESLALPKGYEKGKLVFGERKETGFPIFMWVIKGN